MSDTIIKVDDKHLPVYRILWISDVPHFCGEPDCLHEGDYEIRLDVDESLWTTANDRDKALEALQRWASDPRADESGDW